MKYIDWDPVKNEKLKEERGVSFEDVMDALLGDGLLKTIKHPNRKKYSHQYLHVLSMKDYVYLVPFVEDKERYFFKTIIPSRKARKRYSFLQKEAL